MQLEEILKKLREPIPEKVLKYKSVGGKSIAYIPWYSYCNLLDTRVGMGNWSWAIKSITLSQEKLFMIGTLTIGGDDRVLSMDASGTENLNCSNYGDPSSNAEASCIRRACAKFGLGRQLWEKPVKY